MGEFIEDGLTSSAVLYCLLVLGEASKNLSDEARSSLADIDWATMARFRDLAIHHYHRTDLRQVWDIVVSDLPPLVRRLHGVVLEDEA